METRNNGAVAVTTKQNRVTQQLLMDYLKQTNSNLLPNEMAQFFAIATAFNLDPYKREVYAIAYGQGNGRKLSIIVGYEVYLRRAEEFPQYDGYETEFSGKGADMCCTCKVYRKDRSRPVGSTVFLREYSQGNQMWNTKPHVMLEKVAIATAMRRAFPSEFNGMPYIADELPDKMTNGGKAPGADFAGYAEVVDTSRTEPEAVATVTEENSDGAAVAINENTATVEEPAPQNKPADAHAPLSDKKRADFYDMLSKASARLGSKTVNAITEAHGGINNIVKDRDLAAAVAIELQNTTKEE